MVFTRDTWFFIHEAFKLTVLSLLYYSLYFQTIYFLKVWWQDGTLFVYFSYFL